MLATRTVFSYLKDAAMGDEDEGRHTIADNVRNWIVAAAAVCGVFGAIVYGQIVTNTSAALTAGNVQQIQIDIKEIRGQLDGLPQIVRSLQEQLRDQAASNAIMSAQVNNLTTLTAETKIRVDNLERASNTRLR